ncbi:NAD-dependent epimerase/dehydratase family protein [Streptomyces sp. NPDC021212]|uniref:NAD-dependent epimerase/dehydratase family protein n=1 Tax=Streptomyces sp. NPDC021212 TaxID=3365118 RepID=UPI0037B6AACD
MSDSGSGGPPPRTVVVLGGAGFLGRRVCRAFGALPGHRVLAVTRRPAAPVAGARTVVLDALTGPVGALHEVVADADVVVNAAGDTWEGTEDQMTASHIPLLERLLRALDAAPARPRLVQIGSVHEYGRVPPGTVVREEHPTVPATQYGRTKLAGTRMVLEATAAGAADGCVLRISNMCGPGSPRRSFLGGLALRLRKSAASGTRLSLPVVDERRDFVDVDDVASAVVAAAGAPVSGRLINIGQGAATGMRELAWLLVTVSGLPAHLVDEETVPASGDGSWIRLDTTLAGTLLGWSPRTSLKDSLRGLWEASLQEDNWPVRL